MGWSSYKKYLYRVVNNFFCFLYDVQSKQIHDKKNFLYMNFFIYKALNIFFTFFIGTYKRVAIL